MKPAPWRVEPWQAIANAEYGPLVVVSEDDKVVADGLLAAEANLIAAAPDLLAACKVALSWATDEDAKSLGRHRDAFPGDALRAAIARAEVQP